MPFKTIVAKELKPDTMLSALRKVAKAEAKFADTQFGLTYKTWSNKPTFAQDFKENSRQMVASTLTGGDGSTSNPYPFITRGTSVRYALMTDDFSPKSKVRVIGSSRGKGGGDLC